MIIIGLVGGKACDRAEIGKRLEQFGRHQLQVVPSAESRAPGVRLKALAAALEKASGNRELGGLVVTDVVTLPEADEIRRRGGVIWHVMGTPSDLVPIRRDDALVTQMQGGCRHFLDPLEALSELLLKTARAH
jgi:hypothetical protein